MDRVLREDKERIPDLQLRALLRTHTQKPAETTVQLQQDCCVRFSPMFGESISTFWAVLFYDGPATIDSKAHAQFETTHLPLQDQAQLDLLALGILESFQTKTLEDRPGELATASSI